jgi:hypothetical protein
MCNLPIHVCQTINWLRIAVEAYEAGHIKQAQKDKKRAWQEYEKYTSELNPAAKHR